MWRWSGTYTMYGVEHTSLYPASNYTYEAGAQQHRLVIQETLKCPALNGASGSQCSCPDFGWNGVFCKP